MRFICLNCATINVRPGSHNKFCSNKCQKEFENKLLVSNWKSGIEKGWTGKAKQLKEFIRRYLFEIRGTACEECGWDVRHIDGSILTEIDHVDGDAENCSEENLKILCPNCHAQTTTFRRRNNTSKRKR